MAFLVTLSTLLRSVASRVANKLPNKVSLSEADLLSSVMRKLGELEEKVDTLQAKPSDLPYEKEQLLNAAVRRVDAVEAELIATKKALHEALVRQEELLAYMDRQREAKFRRKKLCF